LAFRIHGGSVTFKAFACNREATEVSRALRGISVADAGFAVPGRVQLSAGVAILTVAFTVGAAFSRPRTEYAGLGPPAEAEVQPSSLIEKWPLGPSVAHLRVPERPLIDLYGNEILPAIGKYTFDLNGALYEEHSPNIALPALQDPEI
jgi:hypothetical protein